ncbi:MAG: CPBP family intramembrane metalloprotease [Candidatus Omnitrophota bacterium]|nr:CPBP family intramembrane metalloprotease [Candidatus Omnitrophota bacterium]MDZ4242823.1 CPBP family intramembrane glutamic endopeptidase [Candidatus Omnitrophota bacterium]
MKKIVWLQIFLLALIGAVIWVTFTYPQLSFIDLSVDRPQAVEIADRFLKEDRGLDMSGYRRASVFVAAIAADQYLQKAVGFKKELEFFKEHNYELFFWKVRYYKEKQTEEYQVSVSAATGEVTGYQRRIDASASRPEVNEDASREQAFQYLQKKFGYLPESYKLHSHLRTTFDNRIEFFFTWEKEGVYIPWSRIEDNGGAILISGITVSGGEVMNFYKQKLLLPDQFNRKLSSSQDIGRNLSVIFRIVYYGLLAAAVFFVLLHKNNLVMHCVKPFVILLTLVLFTLTILGHLNEFQSTLFHYPTTSSFNSYLWQHFSNLILDVFIATIGIIMPLLAGEALHYQIFPHKKEGAFLHYIRTTIFSREFSRTVILGYMFAAIMIGIQSALYEYGQRYLGVWIEYAWMARLSSSYLPVLSALIIGVGASFPEEIMFRMFGISLGKKYLRNTVLACIISCVIWGYGHSGYLVYPMWFRSFEIFCLGLFLSWVYLRHGIVAVIVAHYVFDVFWDTSPYLLGQSTEYHFYSAVSILLLPLLLGLLAFLRNRAVSEKPLRWRLNRHQIFNMEILKDYLRGRPQLLGQGREALRAEIASHGWDAAVVEIVLDDLKTSGNPPVPDRKM